MAEASHRIHCQTVVNLVMLRLANFGFPSILIRFLAQNRDFNSILVMPMVYYIICNKVPWSWNKSINIQYWCQAASLKPLKDFLCQYWSAFLLNRSEVSAHEVGISKQLTTMNANEWWSLVSCHHCYVTFFDPVIHYPSSVPTLYELIIKHSTQRISLANTTPQYKELTVH